MNYVIESFLGWLLVFTRLTAMISFNPVFNRRNMPARVRMGLVMALTILIAPSVPVEHLVAYTDMQVIFAMLWEIFLGFCCGLVFQIFYYMLFFAGDILDIQLGLSMAKVFDPGTSIQMSASGSLFNLMFMLYIFATDSHLILIYIFSSSFQLLPIGMISLSVSMPVFLINLFSATFVLSIKLIIPFAIAEFILEVCMGVLMKIIPQIHVFVINIQLKLVVGILLLFLFAPAVSAFVDNYTKTLLENLTKLLQVAGT